MEIPARYSKCHRILCNLWQSKEERAAKYALSRQLGFNSYESMRMRDWRTETILKAAKAYEDVQAYFKNQRESEKSGHEI